MIDRRVALLRGINVGAANRIAMADLRKVFERLGYDDVRTLLNSGNVVFTVDKAGGDDAARIEEALTDRHGLKVRVIVMKGRELVAAVRENPLSSVANNLSQLLVMAFRRPKNLTQVRPLLKERWSPEVLALGARVAYLWCANGIIESRVWAAVNRAVENEGTARNMATMMKLAALVDGSDGAKAGG